MINIFISHSSECLTNHKLHGDGLVAYEFIKRLANRGHILHVATASMDIKGEIPENINLYPVKQVTSISTLAPIEYMLGVRKLFDQVRKKHQIDLIHQLNPVSRGKSCLLTNTGLPLILGLFVPGWENDLVAQQVKKPFSFGKFIVNLTQPLIEIGDRHQQKYASALLLSTLAAKSRIYSQEFEQKTYCLPYGIDIDKFSPDNHQSTNNQSPIILYLASLTHRKGILTLLDAFEQVIEKVPNCQLQIAGKGEQENAVKSKIEQMSCRKQIALLGMVSRQDISTVMNNCTIYCLPSYGEPFGISAIEAMACGKPVVGTDAGGLGYLIKNEGGRKVPPKNSQALADGLIEILTSEKLQQTMGKFNRDLVEKTYNWEKIIDKLEDIYFKVIHKI